MATEITIVPGILADWTKLPSVAGQPPLCTWPLTEMSGRVKLHQVIVGQSDTLWDACQSEPFEFPVSDLAVHFGEFTSEEKPDEVVSGPILSLVHKDITLHTSSPWVYQALQQLAWIEGPPPWEPAVILRAERLATRKRRDRLAVTLVGRAPVKGA